MLSWQWQCKLGRALDCITAAKPAHWNALPPLRAEQAAAMEARQSDGQHQAGMLGGQAMRHKAQHAHRCVSSV